MRIDETGNRYGRLTVIELYDPAKHGPYARRSETALWYCRCDCGEHVLVRGDSLRRNATRSCGCLRRDTNGRRGKHKK